MGIFFLSTGFIIIIISKQSLKSRVLIKLKNLVKVLKLVIVILKIIKDVKIFKGVFKQYHSFEFRFLRN